MTATELNEYMGREGTWSTPIANVKIRVKVKDVRMIFGRLELKITPLAGSGEAWAQNVELDKQRPQPPVTPSIGTSGAPGGL